VTKTKPTQAHLKSLTNFRQQVYALFETQRDVLFEIMDAISPSTWWRFGECVRRH
jgi:hypothetical protein